MTSTPHDPDQEQGPSEDDAGPVSADGAPGAEIGLSDEPSSFEPEEDPDAAE